MESVEPICRSRNIVEGLFCTWSCCAPCNDRGAWRVGFHPPHAHARQHVDPVNLLRRFGGDCAYVYDFDREELPETVA